MDGLTLASGQETACLVAAAISGDRVAFDRLVHLHAGQVYRVALRMLGDPQEAEDIQQEAFVRAYRRLRSFRGEASFATWLYTITARLCLSRRRQHRSRPEEIITELPISTDPNADPQETLAAREEARRVQQVLAALSPPDRLLIVLRYIERLSHAQIAQVLKCSPESSRARLLRAKRLFREKYQERE